MLSLDHSIELQPLQQADILERRRHQRCGKATGPLSVGQFMTAETDRHAYVQAGRKAGRSREIRRDQERSRGITRQRVGRGRWVGEREIQKEKTRRNGREIKGRQTRDIVI
eukprot:751762-Hanusia_phi.AAC.1